MPYGYKLHNAALGRWLIVGLLLVGPALAQDNERVDGNAVKPTETHQAIAPTPEETDAAFWEDQKGEPKSYWAICKNPHNRADADLCQQWRMARAAEKQANLTFKQFIATIVEIALLVAAVIAAVSAAIYAARASKAAAETVGAMRRSERAYVTISHEPPGLELTKPVGYASFVIKIENSGRTPATVTDVLLKLEWFGDKNPAPNQPDYQKEGPRGEVGYFLVAGSNFIHNGSMRMPGGDVADNELWLYGYVDYTDEFGQCHRSGYARTYRADRNLAGVPPEKINNLVFVDRRDWNYDHDCLPDEDNEEAD